MGIWIISSSAGPQVVSTILRHLGSHLHRGSHVIHSLPRVPVPLKRFGFKLRYVGQASEMQHKDEWIIIGISGVTCGGKTTLALQLKEKLFPVYLFHQDKYFYPDDSPHHIKCEKLEHNNYDILSALDMNAMLNNIKSTLEGADKSNASSLEDGPDKFKIPGKKFLIAEGFTVLNFEPIIKLCNLSYYFVLEFGECAARRCFRVYDPPDIPGYFEQCVWPEHLKYRAQIENDHRVKIIDGTAADALDVVMSDLQLLKAKTNTS